jgi:hypothetical protein
MREVDESKAPADKKPAFYQGIIVPGKHSYGLEHMRIFEWEKDYKLIAGSFDSIAPGQPVFPGGQS